jgi:hypothetical protein
MNRMKNIFLISLLVVLFSCKSSDRLFVPGDIMNVEIGDNFITSDDSFRVSVDSAGLSFVLDYLHGEKPRQTLCKCDITEFAYGSTLCVYESGDGNSRVVFWKIEHEHYPSFKVFYIDNGALKKVGDWGIFTPCDSCDVLDYAFSDVRVRGRNGGVEFLFSCDVEFIDHDGRLFGGDWRSFEAGRLRLFYDPRSETLRLGADAASESTNCP